MAGSAADARFERITNLLALLLHTSVPLTLDDITTRVPGYPGREDHGARRQAFERDKAELRATGVPIAVEPVPGAPDGTLGYRVHADDYYLPDLGLTDDERLALQLALAEVRVSGSTGHEPLALVGDVDVDAAPAVAVLTLLDTLPEINEAQRTRAPVTFTYKGTARTVDVYGVLFRTGFWYAIGREHATDVVKTYRVDRLDGAITTGDPHGYEVPAGFDPAAALPPDPYLIGGDDVVHAELLVDAGHARRVVAQVGAGRVAEERADGSVVVRLPVANPAGFRSWVLGFLDHAEVLGPAELRADVRSWLQAIAAAAAPAGAAEGAR